MPFSVLCVDKSKKILKETSFYRSTVEIVLMLISNDERQRCLLIDFTLSMPFACLFLTVYIFYLCSLFLECAVIWNEITLMGSDNTRQLFLEVRISGLSEVYVNTRKYFF